MAYIGNSPANIGNYQIVDDIASGFNGSLVSFALASGGIAITPAKSGQILANINGVMQEPDDGGTNGFKVTGSNIVFSSAPANGDTFWAVYQGQNVDIGTPSDDVVDTAHIKDDAVTAAKLANSINTAIAANTAKTGITTSQASAITANTAKTGITSSQSSAITANTAKTGITSSQATAITAALPKAGGTMTGDLILGDNVKAKFGAGNDYQLYHDGSDSYVVADNTTTLKIRNTDGNIELQPKTGEVGVKAIADGAVELYHNNVKKLETTASAIQFYGNLMADDGYKLMLGTGTDLQIYHDGSNSYINDTGTGNLNIKGANVNLLSNESEDHLRCNPNGSVDIYHNNVKKLETTATGITATGNGSTILTKSAIGTAAHEAGAGFQNTGHATQSSRRAVMWLDADGANFSGSDYYYIEKTGGGGVQHILQNNSTMKFATNGSTRMTIQPAGGGVSFGTTSLISGSPHIAGYMSSSNPFAVTQNASTGSTNYAWRFQANNTGYIGSINCTNSATQFNSNSDYRLKENIDYDWDATSRLKQLKPARFNWIADDTNTLVDGFIAHEAATVVPEAVTGVKDAMDIETRYTEDDAETQGDNPSKAVGDAKTYSSTKINPQGIDQSKLVPLLVKTIQELEARITALEA